MTRRVALGALVAVATLAGCAPAPVLPPAAAPERSAGTASATGSATGSAEAAAEAATSVASAGPRSCAEVAADLTVEQQVGQLFMLGVSTAGLDETTRQAISRGRIGSVVLLGDTTSGSEPVRMLTATLGSLGTADLPLLVAADQEGGRVQRLAGSGFDDIPGAVEQGRLPGDELRAAAERWGGQLRRAGVRYNLAPVADVVPEGNVSANAPIGALGRHYGSDPAAVADSVSRYVAGMHDAGVVTALKHFPGLGRVDTNTDFGAARDDVTGRDDPGLASFRAGIDAGADSVMVSSAVYSAIDPEREAVFSPAVISDLLRDDLGFDGVVIADDLGAAKSVAGVPAGERAVRFFEAGGDLAINASSALMDDMVTATVERATDDRSFAERVAASAGRVLRLKASAGLLDCA